MTTKVLNVFRIQQNQGPFIVSKKEDSLNFSKVGMDKEHGENARNNFGKVKT
ncbi:MAG: hypothetical protein WD016_04110 [Balneolaceae bacterium]